MTDAKFPDNKHTSVFDTIWGVTPNIYKLKDNPIIPAEVCAERYKITVEEVHAIEKYFAWKLFLYLAEGITWDQEQRPKRNWFTASIVALARPIVRSFRSSFRASAWLLDLQYEGKLSEEELAILQGWWTVYGSGALIGRISLTELNHSLLFENNWYVQNRQEPNKYLYPAPIGVIESVELKALCLLLEKLITGRKSNRPPEYWKSAFGPVKISGNVRPILYGYPMLDMMAAVRATWSWTEALKEEKVLICFKLHASGLIENVCITKSSGNINLDKSAVEAIEKANPLPAFPRHSITTEVDVEFTFDWLFYKYCQTGDLTVYVRPGPQ